MAQAYDPSTQNAASGVLPLDQDQPPLQSKGPETKPRVIQPGSLPNTDESAGHSVLSHGNLIKQLIEAEDMVTTRERRDGERLVRERHFSEVKEGSSECHCAVSKSTSNSAHVKLSRVRAWAVTLQNSKAMGLLVSLT